MYRVIFCCLLVLGFSGFSEARVDFNYSKIFDEYDFYGQSSVTIDGLCTDTCHIFASITEESRKLASNILIQTAKGFTSIAALADQKNATNGQKLSLTISNTPTLTIVNGNAGLAAGPMVLYVVNKHAPNFAGAEVYEAEGLLRPSSMVTAVTVMSARPFTLKQAMLNGTGAASPQGVISHLTGFDALMWHTDTCPNLFQLTYAPFPGFTMEINAPIVSLLYDNQFHTPAGQLSATIGITNRLQLQQAGFFNSPGFHGCAGKQVYRSTLYDMGSAERIELTNETPANIVMDMVTNTDANRPVTITDGSTGFTRLIGETSDFVPVTRSYFSNNLTITWTPDGWGMYHFMARYNSTVLN